MKTLLAMILGLALTQSAHAAGGITCSAFLGTNQALMLKMGAGDVLVAYSDEFLVQVWNTSDPKGNKDLYWASLHKVALNNNESPPILRVAFTRSSLQDINKVYSPIFTYFNKDKSNEVTLSCEPTI